MIPVRARRIAIPLAAAALAFAAAAGPSPAPRRQKLAVLGIRPIGVEKEGAEILTEVALTEAARFGRLEIIGVSDVASLLGLEREKRLLGCNEDSACMAEIGGALGSDLMLVGTLGRLGELRRLDLRLLDVKKAQVLARFGESVQGRDDLLVPAVERGVGQLLGSVAGLPPPAGGTPAPGPGVGAARRYGPGASDRAIKIGNVMPYTGPFATYGAIGRAQAAYFRMVNDQGGVNGRTIEFVSLDDGSRASRAGRLARRLVEEDRVLLVFGSQGRESNLAMRDYLNERKVPQLFITTPAADFADPGRYPWTMGFQASGRTEAVAFARYVLLHRPQARIGVLYPDNAFGKEYLAGLRAGLGDRAAAMIAREESYRASDRSVDRQVGELQRSGADVFFDMATGDHATMAIRAAHDLGWRPLQFVPSGSISIPAILEPAGLEKAAGIISAGRAKGWLSGQEKRDPEVAEYLAWRARYLPGADARDALNVFGYLSAQAMVEVLRRCGDELTRANALRQATSLDIRLKMLLPGVRVTTSPSDYRPIKQMHLLRFDGTRWSPIGTLLGG